jgi:hypothetical protein
MRTQPSGPAGACLLFVIALATDNCGGKTVRTTPDASGAIDIAQLWREPADLETRDLLTGPAAGAPSPAAARFTFIKADRTGHSPGYDVRDQNGVEWSVKLGTEAQTEVVASRILWAIGYHQVPTYYVTAWSMEGGLHGGWLPARSGRALHRQAEVENCGGPGVVEVASTAV